MHGRDEGAIARHFGNSGLKRRNSQPRLLQIHHYVPQMSCQHRRCAGERPRISGCSLGHSAEYLAWGGRLLCAMLTLHNMQGWCPNLAARNSCDVQIRHCCIKITLRPAGLVQRSPYTLQDNECDHELAAQCVPLQRRKLVTLQCNEL